MTQDIAAILLQDGIVSGAIYVLMAIALVVVFTVTRIVLVPQGDLVAFAALTQAALETGVMPGTVWILGLGAALALLLDGIAAARMRDIDLFRRALLRFGLAPAALIAVTIFAVPAGSPLAWSFAVTCALVTCLAGVLYRVAFQPLASASPLVLLIAAIAAHIGLNSIGLHVFGAEGVRTAGFSGPALSLGALTVSVQAWSVLATSLFLVLAMLLFFRFSLRGKALLAAAYHRRGAELVGISPDMAGRTAFLLAGFIAAVSGLLIAPMTTLYYDSGFILGLKGFVAAIVGGLTAYPLAAAGALLVGIIEAFASFWTSAYRDVLVFTLIIPVLVWRSLASPVHDEADE